MCLNLQFSWWSNSLGSTHRRSPDSTLGVCWSLHPCFRTVQRRRNRFGAKSLTVLSLIISPQSGVSPVSCKPGLLITPSCSTVGQTDSQNSGKPCSGKYCVVTISINEQSGKEKLSTEVTRVRITGASVLVEPGVPPGTSVNSRAGRSPPLEAESLHEPY